MKCVILDCQNCPLREHACVVDEEQLEKERENEPVFPERKVKPNE